MPPHDILIPLNPGLFSYRVAGILIRDGKVLLQRPRKAADFAFPGGHVSFGEASAETLVREFKEEVGVEIIPTRLVWVIETFFPWGVQRCQQIGLYYQVALRDETQIPLEGRFLMANEAEQQSSDLEFAWVPIADLDQMVVYPLGVKEKLLNLTEQVEHWVVRQE